MALTPDSASDSKRGAKRDSLMLMADLHGQEGAMLGQARIRNLSATGMMAEIGAAPGLVVGATLRFELRNIGAVTARIAWVRAGKIGLVFDMPIDPQAVRRPVGAGSGAAVAGTNWPAPPLKGPAKAYRPG